MAYSSAKLLQDFVSFAGVRTLDRSATVPWRTLPPKKYSIRFSNSKRRWKSASASAAVSDKHIECNPLLMLPPKNGSISFLDLSKGSSSSLLRVNLPEDPYPEKYENGRYFSSRGWLIKFIDSCISPNYMTLVHPFSRLQLKLPSIETLVASDPYEHNRHCEEGCFITFILTKCVLSSSNPDSLQAMLLYGRDGNLGCARPGGQVWRKINTSNNAKHFVDAIYFQNQFYAINAFGQIFAVKDDDSTATRIAELPAEFIEDVVEYLYMVESEDGTLFVVSRRGVQVPPTHLGYLTEENTFRTLGFQVFEVDLSTNKWSKIQNLGNRSLFLGFNSSLSVDASSNSECKPNCIYFTDDFVDSYWYLAAEEYVEAGGKDTGIYNMENGSIEPFFETDPFHPFNPLMWLEQWS
ncbi:hypothetical protein CUMW_142520 [Citrus unshiu]|nr:hypothetical protein CUMW_142520 [Citrus unshiu]